MARSELLSATPRTVVMTGDYAVFLLFPAIVWVFLVALGAMVWRVDSRNEQIQEHGERSVATIIDRYYASGTTNAEIDYSYQPVAHQPSGANIVTGFGILPVADNLKIGDKIWIMYDPLHPEKSTIYRGSAAPPPETSGEHAARLQVYVGLGVFFGLPPLLFLRKYLRERHMLRWGCIVPAVIIEEKKHYGALSSVTYQFVDDRGKEIRGVRKDVPAREGPLGGRARIMADPIVVFDTRNPARNILFPLETVRLR